MELKRRDRKVVKPEIMDYYYWNNNNNNIHNTPKPFASQADSSSLSFFYNYSDNSNILCPGVEVKQQAATMASTSHSHSHSERFVPSMEDMNYGNREKKKRLRSEQIELLERSFQEEIKLDPERKMKLSRELGLQPRQIAIWFQNRRTRWKAKQLEHLYDVLKHQFDLVSKEKCKLQQEVTKLKERLREREEEALRRRQTTFGGNNYYTSDQIISGEETVESTSEAALLIGTNNSNKQQLITTTTTTELGNAASFTVEQDYNNNSVSLSTLPHHSHWPPPPMPYYYP